MTSDENTYIRPNWPAPSGVRAYVSTRQGGVSEAPFDTLNLGAHVQDDPEVVQENRRRFASIIQMPDSVRWLNQVHGTDVVDVSRSPQPECADGAFANTANQVCAVLTADCLPVFFCDLTGAQVAVAHAGWRGLCAGVIEATLKHFTDKDKVMVWLGPAIGPNAFEVGDEVREAFLSVAPEANMAFKPGKESGKWLANLYLLAKQRLEAVGVSRIYGGDYCTFSDEALFYSYRRDGITGRMASVIWFEEE